MPNDMLGIEEWTEHVSDDERVRAIATTVTRPQPASHIADEAVVEGDVAQKHLAQLVEEGALLADERNGEAMYAPDPDHLRTETLRDLLDAHRRDELIGIRDDLQERAGLGREGELAAYRLRLVEVAIKKCEKNSGN